MVTLLKSNNRIGERMRGALRQAGLLSPTRSSQLSSLRACLLSHDPTAGAGKQDVYRALVGSWEKLLCLQHFKGYLSE